MSTLKSTLKKEVQFILSKDCPAAKQSKYISTVGTGIFWFVLLLILAFVPIGAKKEKYKTVQIVLSSPVNKAVKKAEAPAAQKPTAAPSQEKSAPVVEKTVTPPPAPAKTEQPKTEAKPAPAKKTKAPAKTSAPAEAKKQPAKTPVKQPEVVEYAQDFSDGVDFNKIAPKKNVSWDDISFSDSSTSQTSSTSQSQTVTSKNEISGTAGTTGTTSTAKTSTQSTSTSNTGVSSSVKNSLGQIAETKLAGDSKTTAGTSNVKALVDNGDFKWADGRARNMWYPDSPDIKISPENSPGMSMDVEITFTVTDMGAVTNIQFVQSALLSEGLKTEIRRQISKWMFDEADTASAARFLLKIRTK